MTGERVDLEEVVRAVGTMDVVVLGELHGHPTGLPLHAELFERSLERYPQAALCLEFLTRETQHLVDAYLAGILDWEDFAEAADQVPGSSPQPHRPLIDAARDAGVPVSAANAPRLYTSTARKHGYERLAQLTAEQRRLFDVPATMPDDAYKARFFEVMGADAESDEAGDPERAARVEDAFRSQCLWDATMASSVTRRLEQGRRPVFLVVGSFHCNTEGGTVQMIRRQGRAAGLLVVSFVASSSDVLLDEHRELADFVAYVGPFPEDD